MHEQPPKTESTLLILGARPAQVPAIRTALDMGLKVVAIDPDPAAPGLAIATWGYTYDLADEDTILALARDHHIDGIMTIAADFPMPTIANICEALHLPGPLPDVVARATNKRLMRMALSTAGLICPRFVHVVSPEQARQAVADLETDTIFKPVMSHGGRGVTLLAAGSSNEAVDKAFHRALLETRMDGVLVEEFIDGPEFSVETLTHQGVTRVIAVTDKLTSGPPYYVEMGHNQPSRWPTSQVKILSETAVQAVAALGIDQAAGHTEIRLAKREAVVMEVAARLGGGFINSQLVPLSTGVDLVAATIQVSLGKLPNLQPKSRAGAAAIRFLSAPVGTVTCIEGLEDARQIKGVKEVDVYVKPHDQIVSLVDATGRPGHVICIAPDPERAIAIAEQAAQAIHIHTVPTR